MEQSEDGMMQCALEGARRPVDWSGEAKGEITRNKANKVYREDHAGHSRPWGKELFILVST